MLAALEVPRHNTQTRFNKLSHDDNQFNKNLATIFSLASSSHELLKSSELEEKRRIITILFSNLLLDSENLVTPRKPFDLFMNWVTALSGSDGRTRTYNQSINSRLLYH